jgi:hypothetical protein
MKFISNGICVTEETYPIVSFNILPPSYFNRSSIRGTGQRFLSVTGLFGWFMVFNATFNRGEQIYWWRKPEYPEKTIDLLMDAMAVRTRCSPEQTFI